MNAGVALLALVAIACAKPNVYREPDAAATDGEAVVDSAPLPDQRMQSAADLGPDVSLTPVDSAGSDHPPAADAVADQAASDAPIDGAPDVAGVEAAAPDVPRPPDADTRKAAGATCGDPAECMSGSCTDGVCCKQTCSVCQQCKGPDGTCQSIPAGQPDSSPAGSCMGTGSCDGANPPKCVQCTKCTDGTCIRNRYDFDNAKLDGAMVEAGNSQVSSTVLAVGPQYLGQQTLAMVISVGLEEHGSFRTFFDVCQGAATSNLRTKAFRLRAFLEADPTISAPLHFMLFMQKEQLAFFQTSIPVGTWVLLEGRLPADEDPDVSRLSLYIATNQVPKWSGRIWLDDLRIE